MQFVHLVIRATAEMPERPIAINCDHIAAVRETDSHQPVILIGGGGGYYYPTGSYKEVMQAIVKAANPKHLYQNTESGEIKEL